MSGTIRRSVVMKPSTRQAIARICILLSPLGLLITVSAVFWRLSLLPAALVAAVGVFLELSRIRMRIFTFPAFVSVVWVTAAIATLTLRFVLCGALFFPSSSAALDRDALLSSFHRHEAALDSNFQRRDWTSDVPAVGAKLETLSVVINAHNEHAYLVRTLESILETSRSHLVEIIVVDDGSQPPLLPLVQNAPSLTSLLPHSAAASEGRVQGEPWIHVVRHEKQEGLIRSKIHGASLASGDLVVFLDAHVKAFPDWVEPMLVHVNANYKRLVAPVIPILSEDWTVKSLAVGYKMMFDWALDFNWFDDLTWPGVKSRAEQELELDAVPVLSGGLFGISRRWWFESGEYDAQMLNYGAENIEQSLRVWLCGGEIVVARNSRIAHLFRPKFPYKVDDRLVMTNKARTVKVWFNDGEAEGQVSEWQERVLQGDPNLRAFMSLTGDLSERMQLRRQCRDFSWFVHRFKHVFERRGLLDKQGSLLRVTGSQQDGDELCVSGLPVKHLTAFKVTTVKCDAKDPLQSVQLEQSGTTRRVRVKALCLDANAAERDKADKPLLWYHCDFGTNKNQDWVFQDGQLRWSPAGDTSTDVCASVVDKELVMTSPCSRASSFSPSL